MVISRISSSLVFILVLLIMLGHACELPLGSIVEAHTHETAHDSSEHHDHHEDEGVVDCDAVLAVPSGTQASSGLDVTVRADSHPLLDAVAVRLASAGLPESDAVPRRLPLFLLHSVLLI